MHGFWSTIFIIILVLAAFVALYEPYPPGGRRRKKSSKDRETLSEIDSGAPTKAQPNPQETNDTLKRTPKRRQRFNAH